jgi:4-carboxymuconolactone decarboxylase
MNHSASYEQFSTSLDSFSPDSNGITRALAIYSAAIAFDDEKILDRALSLGEKQGCHRSHFYEIMLQSYLFLGFPRMLNAAMHLSGYFGSRKKSSPLSLISAEESALWFDRGVALCKRVYDNNYDRLKQTVEKAAPEVFRWMIIEGYGKVLSRGELEIVTREMAVVSSLMVENRPRQLHSHIRGALNVGCPPVLIETIINDIGSAAGDGYRSALDIMKRLNLS